MELHFRSVIPAATSDSKRSRTSREAAVSRDGRHAAILVQHYVVHMGHRLQSALSDGSCMLALRDACPPMLILGHAPLQIFMKRNSVYLVFVFGGAIIGERVRPRPPITLPPAVALAIGRQLIIEQSARVCA